MGLAEFHKEPLGNCLPVSQNAPYVSAGMNVLDVAEGRPLKVTNVSLWHGVYCEILNEPHRKEVSVWQNRILSSSGSSVGAAVRASILKTSSANTKRTVPAVSRHETSNRNYNG